MMIALMLSLTPDMCDVGPVTCYPACLLNDSLFPNAWVSMLMEDGYDVNRHVGHFEVNGVWKPVKQGSAKAIPDIRKLKGHLGDALHHYCVRPGALPEK